MLLQTFRPNKKSFPEGTLRYHLHRQANASLNSGLDLKLVVKLPRGEDLNEWIAVHGSFCLSIRKLFYAKSFSPGIARQASCHFTNI